MFVVWFETVAARVPKLSVPEFRFCSSLKFIGPCFTVNGLYIVLLKSKALLVKTGCSRVAIDPRSI